MIKTLLLWCSFVYRPVEGHFLRMRWENLFGAFGAILIFSAHFCGFSTERSTPFCDTSWRGMKEYDKFTTISNSVDTPGVCWLFGWGYFNDQSANKTRKKAENLKFEIWFADDQDVHMRLQTLKVSLKMLISYFYESRSGLWRRSWDILILLLCFGENFSDCPFGLEVLTRV